MSSALGDPVGKRRTQRVGELLDARRHLERLQVLRGLAHERGAVEGAMRNGHLLGKPLRRRRDQTSP